VKSGAAAMVTSPASFSGIRFAIRRLIHPPMEDPTRTTGPSVSAVIAASASSAQSPMQPSVNSPLLAPCPE
jgi:hypothetical protein